MSDKLTLTGPMCVLLLGADENGLVPTLYPGGQQRLIVSGLADRGLVERAGLHSFRLTPEGFKVACKLGQGDQG